MASQFQIRRALNQLSNVAAFLSRHPQVSERTVYRQRSDDPTRMRKSVAATLETALTEEGLLRAQKPQKSQPARRRPSAKKPLA